MSLKIWDQCDQSFRSYEGFFVSGCTLLCFTLRSSSTPFSFLFSRFPREITLATTQNFVRTCPLWPKTWGPSQFSKLRCSPSFWYISSFGKGYMWGHTFSDRRSPQPFNPLRELYWIWVLWEESTLVLYDPLMVFSVPKLRTWVQLPSIFSPWSSLDLILFFPCSSHHFLLYPFSSHDLLLRSLLGSLRTLFGHVRYGPKLEDHLNFQNYDVVPHFGT